MNQIITKHLKITSNEETQLIRDFVNSLYKDNKNYHDFKSAIEKNGEFSNDFINDVYKLLRDDSVKLEINEIILGYVSKITDYGAFIRFNNYSGLCHISQISKNGSRINSPNDLLSKNQQVYCKIINIIDRPKLKISLSMRNINQETGEEEEEKEAEIRGRSFERTLKKRKLTSPERWELKQLKASGASIDIELSEDEDEHQDDEEEIGSAEIEQSTIKPNFLQGMEIKSEAVRIEKVIQDDPNSLDKIATLGSKFAKKYKETHKEKPTIDQDELKKKLSFGKKTTTPIEEQRKSLPVYSMRQELINVIKDNQFVVIVGETGSGKTTQIVQYIYEEQLNKGKIIGCTQPRRVAATSVAKRVAEEVGCKVGDIVGYNVRFDDNTSPKTKIKYLTDGMLEREALNDPLMSKYSVIMLDEAHERTIATDVLFALLKKACSNNPNLQVIVTSATLDSDKFSKFFNNCPILKIPGRTYPVEILYTRVPEMDYLKAALDSVFQIHLSEPQGDILVFLTGQDEIDTSCDILLERMKNFKHVTTSELIVLPVYSSLPSEIQSRIFEPTPTGSRKCILATNIAETSITIDGIYFVIDPGYVKLNAYDPKLGMDSLKIKPISQAQANQRSGRAGRTGPGKCYRLYTESAYLTQMLPNTIPEIQRQNLSHTILMLKAMGINDVLKFDFMDPPSMNTLLNALQDLYILDALDNDGNLTLLGKKMANFPMEPALAKTLIKSVEFDCTEEILTIVAMLSVQSIFYRPKDKQQESDQRKAKFHSSYGDHLTLLNVYQKWIQNLKNPTWCKDNFIQERSMRKAMDIRKQLTSMMLKYNYNIKSCGNDINLIRKTLCCGYFKNSSRRDNQGDNSYKTINASETSVYLHPSSSLFGKAPEYLIYHSLLLTTKEYMHCCTIVESKWLYEYAPKYFKLSDKKKQKIQPLFDRSSQMKKDDDNKNNWRLSTKRNL
ncbi:unnamed protein product [Candida verbasci]|uniref:RNA helicase n=1 Tax=Candida verbasci TaxID=1227364 RepID=A0A9W4TYK8_9ASCO|nr:unnamed protein product [Candida verbasci]